MAAKIGGKELPGLSNAVRAYRSKRVRDFLQEHYCDAIAVSTPDWFEWMSNNEIHEQGWERPYLLVLTVSGQSFAVASEISRHHFGAAAKRGSLWIDAVHHYAESPHRGRDGHTLLQWPELVADALNEAGLSRARIAVDSLSKPLARVAALLPKLQIREAGEALRRLRWVKHPDEVETMRRAAALSDWAMDAYREELSPGRLLTEIDYRVAARLAAEAARRLPGENFVISGLLTLSGATSAGPKGDGAPSGRVLESDTVVITTLGTRLNGVSVEVARSWLIGSPPQHVVTLFDCALAAQRASIEAAVAERPVSGIHSAALEVFSRAGVEAFFNLRAGHGIGVIMHDFPEDLPFCDRPLVAGETYAIEPSLCVPDIGGFRFSDTILVNAGRAEHVTRAGPERARQILN